MRGGRVFYIFKNKLIMVDIKLQKSWENSQEILNISKNMVIVWSNWSGKSRFWSKIEQLNSNSKRISAQRYLQLQDVIQKQDYETSKQNLERNYKNKPVTQPQNDYQQVLISLFAEESRRNESVVEEIKEKWEMKKDDLQVSKKEKTIDIWNYLFPAKPLILEKDRVKMSNNSSKYSATEMSDGEKVALYLIAQVLLAEENCILIIDEPELHLHKALMVRLWNKLEEYRDDCVFIYITHDLDFATSKPVNETVWIKNYNNNIWERLRLDKNEYIPEDLYLEILWSKQPILFVEGERWSYDIQIYQVVYEGFTVIPCGSCKKVIESVKWLKNHTHLHNNKFYWIIDKDFRSNEELEALKNDWIFHTDVNEIENIFLVTEFIELICNHLMKVDKKDEIINKIKEIYISQKTNIEFQSKKYSIYKYLNEELWKIKTQNEYDNWKREIINNLDTIMSKELLEDNDDILYILKKYPHKWLVRQIQPIISLVKDWYQDLIFNFLNSSRRKDVVWIFMKYLPNIITE